MSETREGRRLFEAETHSGFLCLGGTMLHHPEIPEIQLTYRNPVDTGDRITLLNHEHSIAAFRSVWPDYEHREYFMMLLLNNVNHVLGNYLVSVGGLTEATVDTRIIFQVALKANATGIMVAHNHPSGLLKPSASDINFTYNLRNAGRLLRISVIDHFILTRKGYYSFSDHGYL